MGEMVSLILGIFCRTKKVLFVWISYLKNGVTPPKEEWLASLMCMYVSECWGEEGR
jgi:hypothetical protein